jgi:hypothetical protein
VYEVTFGAIETGAANVRPSLATEIRAVATMSVAVVTSRVYAR